MPSLFLRSFIITACLISMSLLSLPAFADDAGTHTRPKIGLVLSGGGAKGAAHIGVLKVLERLNVPIDYVAGTSMGSVVGGLYAAGRSPDDIEEQVKRIDWEQLFIDEPDRAVRSQQRKREEANFLAKSKPRVKEGEVNLAPALIQGQRLGLELRKLVLPVAHIEDFDDLAIPFRAVATDAMTGEAVVLGAGDLAQAIRASMAVPMIFAPVELDGRVLIDGGVVRNTPVSVVREMGADIVIVVMLESEPVDQATLSSPLMMLAQLTNLLMAPGIQTEMETLTEKDIVITADLRGIGAGDFVKMEQAIPRGLKAAEAQQAALQALAIAPQPRPRLPKATTPVIAFIDIEHDADVSDDVLYARLDQETGQPLDFAALEAGISRLYGTDLFSQVDYEVVEKDGQQGLKIRAKEKPWGTSFIQGGLQLSANLEGNSFFNLGLSYTQRPMNRLGGEWRSAVTLGEEPQLNTEWYQPLDAGERWFVRAGAAYQTTKIKLFVDDLARTEYRASAYGVQLSAGRNLGAWGNLTANLDRLFGKADVVVGDASNPNFDFEVGEFSLRLIVDTMDNVAFPREGQFGTAAVRWSREMLGADQDFEQFELAFLDVRSWGDHTVNAGLIYETALDNAVPIQGRYRLGGFMRLSGLQENQITGEHAALARVGYQYRLSAGTIPTYAGVSFEVGNVWDTDPEWGDLRSSVGAYLGADTLLGPIYLGYGLHEGKDHSFYLFLGQPWF